MSHELDFSNNRANIAYVGEEPWHGLGQKLLPGQTIDEWVKAAGLQWHAEERSVLFNKLGDGVLPPQFTQFQGKRVLLRSDTGVPLSIAGEDYKIVQPREIIDIFRQLSEIGGFEMETMGALSGGQRIWGLARISDTAKIAGTADRVTPYILFATSYDGSLATIGKFTAIRVVCHNTISMVVGYPEAFAGRRVIPAGEVYSGPRTNTVRITHNQKFDGDAMRIRLGLVRDAWEQFQFEAGVLAEQEMSEQQFDEFLCELIRPLLPRPKMGDDGKVEERDPHKRKGFAEITQLFLGAQLGADLVGRTKWAALNAVTEYVDHKSGRTQAGRVNSAWFGNGGALKERARELLLAA